MKYNFKNLIRKRGTIIVLIWGITLLGHAQNGRHSLPLKHGAHRIGVRTDEQMENWRGYGLGQFIHWGVYSIPGGTWKGQEYTGAAEWIRSWDKMSKEEYDQLYKQFDPAEFDAQAWARQAREMGVRYMIFTTKHHDGFCLWPSRYSDYTVAQSPYKRDILRQIVDAYTAEGIDVYFYFSIIDWNHPGYRPAVPETEEQKTKYELFKTYTRNQLMELLNSYPEAKGFWFDGSWDKAWINEAEWADKLGKELREIRPGLVIGSRFRADEYGNRRYDQNGDMIEDYDQAWERELPDRLEDVLGNDWECVMTIPENQWGYQANWRGYVKTPYDLIEMMMKSISLNGNFVLNFGPDPSGKIRPEECEIATEIGKWMKVNGEAVYGTGYSGLKDQGWGLITRKGNYYYLSVFNVPINRKLHIEFPKEAKNL
ncbi:MAG: alpha-L-fucosidase [Bacteroides sp.]|nr:alpha-L-fucosidase [Bacteroides sp.]